MDRARGNVEEIARLDGLPVEQLLDTAVECGRAQLRPLDGRLGPERDRRTGLGAQDQTAFVLSALPSAGMRLRITRVDLNRQLFARAQIFSHLVVLRFPAALDPSFSHLFPPRLQLPDRGP